MNQIQAQGKSIFQRNKVEIIYIFVLALLPFLFYLDTFFTGYLASSSDYLRDAIQPLTSNHLAKESLLQGSSPFWNIFEAGGIPRNAPVPFTPFFWLAFFAPVATSYMAVIASYMAIGAVSLFLFLKELGVSPHAAFFSGIALIFSSSVLFRSAQPTLLAAILFTPLTLLLTEKMAKNGGKLKYSLYAGIALALQAIMGFSQMVMYACIFVVVYYVARCIHAKIRAGRIISSLALAFAVMLGLWAIVLLPTLQTIGLTGRAGSTPYAFFAAGAHDIGSLLALVSPSAWVMSTDAIGRGLLSADAYFGLVVFVLFLFGAIHSWKKFHVKLLTILAALAFLFIIAPTFPLLGNIIYKIPIIGSFRFSSRAVFIMQICMVTVAAFGLNDIIKEGAYRKYLRFSLVFAGVVSVLMGILYLNRGSLFAGVSADIIEQNRFSFWGAIVVTWINALVAFIFSFLFSRDKRKYISASFAIVLSALCFFDVLLLNTYMPLQKQVWDRFDISALRDTELTSFLNENAGREYRSVRMAPDYEGRHLNSAYRMNMLNGFLDLGGYDNYSNPDYLDMLHASADFTIGDNPHPVNLSVYSMLSVKYFAVPEDSGFQPYELSPGSEIYSLPGEITIPAGEKTSIWKDNISIEPDKAYILQAEIETASPPAIFYFDFYSKGFNDASLNMSPPLAQGAQTVTRVVSTTGMEVPEKVSIRAVALSDSDIVIKSLRVYEAQVEEIFLPIVASMPDYALLPVQEGTLAPDGNTVVYENPDAKPLVYSADAVKGVEDKEDVMQNVDLLDFDDNIFVVGHGDMDLSGSGTEISITGISDNYVTADVSSKEDTFVVMAQNYHPNWKAFVDGIETPIYLSNGVLLGIDVPAGAHSLRFEYVPTYFYIGAAVTGCTAAVVAILLIWLARKGKRDKPKITG